MGTKRKVLIAGIGIGVATLSIASAIYLYVHRLPFTSNGTSVVITLERTPCFGTCPAYKLTIYGGGLAVYEGMAFVAVKGIRITSIGEKKVQELISEFEKAGFFSLNDSYLHGVTDTPGATTTIAIDGRTKSILHHPAFCSPDWGDAPKELCDLESKIDEIVNSRQWIGDSN